MELNSLAPFLGNFLKTLILRPTAATPLVRMLLETLISDARQPYSSLKDSPNDKPGLTVDDIDDMVFARATNDWDFYRFVRQLARKGVMLKLRPARGADFYAGIEVIFPGKEPIYFSLDVAKDPR